METEDTPTTGISRRTVLKRAAVGGAVVWAAPAITTMTSPAYAQGSPVCIASTCVEFSFGSQTFHAFAAPPPGQEGCPCVCAGLPTNDPCTNADPCSVQIQVGPLTPGPCP